MLSLILRMELVLDVNLLVGGWDGGDNKGRWF